MAGEVNASAGGDVKLQLASESWGHFLFGLREGCSIIDIICETRLLEFLHDIAIIDLSFHIRTTHYVAQSSNMDRIRRNL